MQKKFTIYMRYAFPPEEETFECDEYEFAQGRLIIPGEDGETATIIYVCEVIYVYKIEQNYGFAEDQHKIHTLEKELEFQIQQYQKMISADNTGINTTNNDCNYS